MKLLLVALAFGVAAVCAFVGASFGATPTAARLHLISTAFIAVGLLLGALPLP